MESKWKVEMWLRRQGAPRELPLLANMLTKDAGEHARRGLASEEAAAGHPDHARGMEGIQEKLHIGNERTARPSPK